MGNSRSATRKLKERNVWIAQETDHQKIKFFQQLVEEKVKTDAKFAQDVLKAVGETIPKEIKEAAEETIAREKKTETGEEIVTDSLLDSCEKSDQHKIT